MSLALVPAAATAAEDALLALAPLIKSGINPRNRRFAAAAAKMAWNNRGSYARPNKRARKARRGGTAKRAAPSAKTQTKQHGEMDETTRAVQMKTLKAELVSFPSLGTGIGGRLSSQINLRGIKVCEEFYNDNDFPIEVHFAIVQLKHKAAGDDLGEIETSFFRDTTSDIKRSRNFPTGGVGSDLKAVKCLPLNPDKFHIITHTKRTLGSVKVVDSSAGNQSVLLKESGFHWKHDRYYKINRTVAFDEIDQQLPERPFYCLYWWAPVDPAFYDNGNSLVRHNFMRQIYFNSKT